MKRSLLGLFIIVATIGYVVVASAMTSVEYGMENSAEQLKNQLQEEYSEFSTELVQDIEIQRPWYSMRIHDWTYVVTLSENRGVHTYVYREGMFCEIPAENRKYKHE